MIVWVSKHIITKPYEYQKDKHVDFAGLDGRTPASRQAGLPYQGRSHQPRVGKDEKSAEAIVDTVNEPQ